MEVWVIANFWLFIHKLLWTSLNMYHDTHTVCGVYSRRETVYSKGMDGYTAIVFRTGCTNYTPTPQLAKWQLLSALLNNTQYYLFFSGIPVSVYWYCIMTSICISLLTKDVEQHFVCLLFGNPLLWSTHSHRSPFFF